MEREAKVRAVRERSSYERKAAVREAREGRRQGRKIKPPKATPQGKEQTNLTDPHSGLMRKNKTLAYRPAYDAQCVVDAEGRRLMVGSRVSRCASDRKELSADIEAIPGAVGDPKTVFGGQRLCERS